VTSPPADVNVTFGTEEKFLCEFVALGNSPAEVTWRINDRPLSACLDIVTSNRSEGDYVVLTSSLTVPFYGSPLLSGVYLCTANVIALASFSVHVLGELLYTLHRRSN